MRLGVCLLNYIPPVPVALETLGFMAIKVTAGWRFPAMGNHCIIPALCSLIFWHTTFLPKFTPPHSLPHFYLRVARAGWWEVTHLFSYRIIEWSGPILLLVHILPILRAPDFSCSMLGNGHRNLSQDRLLAKIFKCLAGKGQYFKWLGIL